MKKYEKYKESGIQWIGQVPEHWDIVKFKYFADCRMGETILASETTESGIPIYSATQDDSIFGHIENPKLLLKQGDIVIPARGNSIGCVSMVKEEKATCTQTTICAQNIHDISTRFLYFCCVGFKQFWFHYEGGAIPQITVDQVLNNVLVLPPLSEQQAIAEYLDKKTAKIDESVAALEAQKGDLQKYRAAVISEAVTRGLDAAAKMKDSGVEWIGEIPEGWKCLPIKRFATIQTGTTPSTSESRYFDGDFNWFTPGDFKGQLLLTDSNRKLSQLAVEDRACRVFPAGSIYIIGIGGTLGKVAACAEQASSNQQITVISPNELMNYKYAAYYLSTKREVFETKANAATLPILSSDAIATFSTPVPPLSEQQAIAEYLDKKTAKIDESIALIDAQIADLQAFRSAVISEAVTGKVKAS